MMYTASFKLRFNSGRSMIDPLIDGVTPLPLSLPFHFPLLLKPHSLYCSILTSIYFVLSPFLSASTQQMSEALLACLCGLVSASLCQGLLRKVRAAAFSHCWHMGTKGPVNKWALLTAHEHGIFLFIGNKFNFCTRRCNIRANSSKLYILTSLALRPLYVWHHYFQQVSISPKIV